MPPSTSARWIGASATNPEELGTPCCDFAGASCASGYHRRVLAVMTTLGILVGVLATVLWCSRRVETATAILGGIDVERWRSGAEGLTQGGAALRDAVDLRERR